MITAEKRILDDETRERVITKSNIISPNSRIRNFAVILKGDETQPKEKENANSLPSLTTQKTYAHSEIEKDELLKKLSASTSLSVKAKKKSMAAIYISVLISLLMLVVLNAIALVKYAIKTPNNADFMPSVQISVSIDTEGEINSKL